MLVVLVHEFDTTFAKMSGAQRQISTEFRDGLNYIKHLPHKTTFYELSILALDIIYTDKQTLPGNNSSHDYLRKG